MGHAEHTRIYVSLVLLCILVSMHTILLLQVAGGGLTVLAIVVGLVLATIVTGLTTSLR